MLKPLYAAVIRAAERWHGISAGDFEQRLLRAIREEYNRAHAALVAPAIPVAPPTICSRSRRA